ncbi:SH3-like domain-containing protein [Rhodothalassium salexigens DSM 2132]|uniref:SH3-like domain-containing protein n=1 Tax=Rhodothalassium salexigens DSM 2132 TaxID=1188247 RepID=A0A4R2PKK2_RHOSA|nr:SH3 domain-containing protein [Rhodothalassium salexigens]MBB4211276.1 SH3-like domain-containing protein [Rhodothalassium salexigens DSM 2132]MBK1639600.1 hypothetical protein [Rhodothalassium salexigens DSM 2132]TCP35198.1 SH3-like domain-containing protein [Rhodothalassium salexigens DSM 2132]
MRRKVRQVCLALGALAVAVAAGPSGAGAQPVARDHVSAGPSGQPVPRFVSLRASKANMRVGPDRKYPIRWQYRRPGLPLLVVGEFDVWREVRDPEGDTGWMHVALLTGARTVMVAGQRPAVLRHRAEAGAPGLLEAEPGVTGDLLGCTGAWCEVRIGARTGWLPRARLWGVFAERPGRRGEKKPRTGG